MRRAGLFAAVALAGSCVGAEPVTMRWAFGAEGVGCRDVGVRTVHVHLGPLAPEGSYDHEVRCTVGDVASEGIRLHDVAPGPHTLVLKGLTEDRVLFFLETEIVVPAGGDLGTFIVPPYVPPP